MQKHVKTVVKSSDGGDGIIIEFIDPKDGHEHAKVRVSIESAKELYAQLSAALLAFTRG